MKTLKNELNLSSKTLITRTLLFELGLFCLMILIFSSFISAQIIPAEKDYTRYQYGIWIEKLNYTDKGDSLSISFIKRDPNSWQESYQIWNLSKVKDDRLLLTKDDGTRILWESPTKVILIDKDGKKVTLQSKFPIVFFETEYLSINSGILKAYFKEHPTDNVLRISTPFLGKLVDLEFRKSKKRIDSFHGSSSNVWIWTGEKIIPRSSIPVQYSKAPFDLIFTEELQLVGWFDPVNDDVSIQKEYETFTSLKLWNEPLISKPIYKVMILEEKLMIPMSDGISLAATVLLPDNPELAKKNNQDGPFPTILIRTPYGRENSIRSAFKFVSRGYAVVAQDTRGRGDSDGIFMPLIDEKSDGDETISFIAKQPWSNGNIGMIGASYSGVVQWHAAYKGNPHLKALISQVAGGGAFVDWPNRDGSFLTGVLAWTLLVGSTPEEYRKAMKKDLYEIANSLPLIDADMRAVGHVIAFWREWLKHPTKDEFWKKGDISLWSKNIDLPALFISGWFDDVLRGTIDFYGMMKREGRKNQHLILGPWLHGFNRTRKIGDIFFGDDAIREDLNYIYVHWFDRWLKGIDNGVEKDPPVRYYTVGENKWSTAIAWPPKNVKKQKLYLHSKGKATNPEDGGTVSIVPPGKEKADHYVFDPINPTPFLVDMSTNEMSPPADYQKVERRKDTLVYTSEVLQEDFKISGDISAVIYASTNCRDTDWLIRLTDVFPDGQSIRLVDGLVKARFQKSVEKEELITPGKVYKYRIPMTWASHKFLKGHRLRVSIASAAAGLYAVNTNTGKSIATDTEYKIANQTIYHDKNHPSHIILPVQKIAEN